MSKSKGIINFERIKINEGLNQARQDFDIGHSLFLVRYFFSILKLNLNTEGLTPQYPAANTLLNLYRYLMKKA